MGIRDVPHDDLWIDPEGKFPLLKNQICPTCRGEGTRWMEDSQEYITCDTCKGLGKGV